MKVRRAMFSSVGIYINPDLAEPGNPVEQSRVLTVSPIALDAEVNESS